ncbi:MAG: M20/M25/M40 family metallo-hydrolase [Methanoregula sp.]|jgi:succinyl-diaminopimelate desuccinylase|uniref:M20/M25/M40 family metallo-hydrolase n=1 Tax=Methanoregula sp. TaxID=2052170 RepID=UPI003D12A4B6
MDVSRICAALVAIKSENPPGDTSGVIEYIRDFLDARGIISTVTDTGGGRCNLVTRGPKKPLLLCGHVDVVPALDEGWTHPPCSGILEDGYVWGRGATDMKGGCAAMLAASDMLVQEDHELPATLAFVCDEETGGDLGIQYLIAHNLIAPCDCLIAEPSPARHPCIGQKGLCRLDLKFAGTPGHGSLYPTIGVSAIMEAMELLEYIKSLHNREFPMDEKLREIIRHSSEVFSEEFQIQEGSDILERVTFNPGIISGGEKINIIAQHCSVNLELRIPWGCSIPDLVIDIRAHAQNGTIVERIVHDPSLTDPDCEFAAVVCREVEKVWGGDVFPILQWAASDARHLRCAGFQVIEYGPGELATLHGINERISVVSLENAVKIYRGILDTYSKKTETS